MDTMIPENEFEEAHGAPYTAIMSKRFFIGANWKMNERPMAAELDAAEGKQTCYHSTPKTDVVVFPTFIQLRECLRDRHMVGAQYGHPDDSGAFTGDISMAMLAGIQVAYVLCGHSERRAHHGESDAFVAAQFQSALRCGLLPVLCIGETAEERAAKRTNDVLKIQLAAVLSTAKTALTEKSMIVAYEPVWAIGTGKTPTAAEVQQTHAYIRSLLPSPNIRIIYGGSVNGKNAADFFKEKDVDGALVGGASLKPEEFASIVSAASA
jgi:triosephosphate isomerase